MRSPLRLFLGVAMAATVLLGVWMARPWGDNDAYQDISGYLRLSAFLLWATSPLAMLALMAGAFRRSRVSPVAFAVGAACIALAGIVAYANALLFPDAQGGLAFLFVPLAQWGAAACLVAVCCAVDRLVAR